MFNLMLESERMSIAVLPFLLSVVLEFSSLEYKRFSASDASDSELDADVLESKKLNEILKNNLLHC